jgi:hypothetical protein
VRFTGNHTAPKGSYYKFSGGIALREAE